MVNHGVPIDPDYNIITEPKNVIDNPKPGQRPGGTFTLFCAKLECLLRSELFFVAKISGGCKVVELSPRHLKVNGSNPATPDQDGENGKNSPI